MTKDAPKKVAIILSGCGRPSGSEIHETCSLIFSFSKLGFDISYFSIEGKDLENNIDIYQDSNKLARGSVQNIKDLVVGNMDAIAFPGGPGAAQHLCNLKSLIKNPKSKFKLHGQVERVINEGMSLKKPMIFVCIAPVLVANKAKVTLGPIKDTSMFTAIKKFSKELHETTLDEVYVDKENRVISCAAYMIEGKPIQIYKNIKKGVKEINKLLTL
eukprot:GAHX01001097.1.p2 GENE.GAHX01001097.1~~GAHX01001097.1.p2  ORF type:complete len:215 (-),score=51.02 GAHX01001097.1:1195-1839(-)